MKTHNEAILMGLNAHRDWIVQEGGYSHPESGKGYKVSYHKNAFGYSCLFDSEIIHNSRIKTETKIALAIYLGDLYQLYIDEIKSSRGAKIGIEADLTNGGIAYNQDSKITLKVIYHKTVEDTVVFEIQKLTRGKQVSKGHRISIDSNDNIIQGMRYHIAPLYDLPNA